MFVAYCLEKTGKSNGVHLFQQQNDDYDALMFVDYCLDKAAGNNKGVHFFQQYDDDYDATMFVEYWLKKQLDGAMAFTSPNTMLTITMLVY